MIIINKIKIIKLVLIKINNNLDNDKKLIIIVKLIYA